MAAAALTHQRLHSGGQTGKNRNAYERKVGNDAIGSNTGRAGQPQQNQIEQEQDDRRGDLADQGGKARGP